MFQCRKKPRAAPKFEPDENLNRRLRRPTPEALFPLFTPIQLSFVFRLHSLHIVQTPQHSARFLRNNDTGLEAKVAYDMIVVARRGHP